MDDILYVRNVRQDFRTQINVSDTPKWDLRLKIDPDKKIKWVTEIIDLKRYLWVPG